MSFAGLQGRLQKKKELASVPPSVDPPRAPSNDSLYANAAAEAQAKHSLRKRSRSPLTPDRSTQPQSSDASGSACGVGPSLAGASRPALLDEAAFLARRRLAEAAVTRCAAAISTIVQRSSPVLCDAPALPAPLCAFLERRHRRGTATAGEEEDEQSLLAALQEAPAAVPITSGAGRDPHREAIVVVLRAFWLVLCWHWRTALRAGWSYDAYLLSRHALPGAVQMIRGKQTSLALEAWNEACRVRRDAMDFMALALHDLKEDCAEKRSVPADVVESLAHIVHHLRRREFPSCRQLYVDLTMGTANWKLGLFSGGEVHMRRSMERIERRRIAHLLHNEDAVRLLHALRELVDFVQQHEVDLSDSGIFVDQKEEATMKN